MAANLKRFWPLFVALVATGGIVGWGGTRLGSFAATRAYLRGEPLIVDHPAIELGRIKAGVPVDIHVPLRSITSEQVRLTGCRATCGCVRLRTKLPLTIEPHTTADLWLIVLPDEDDVKAGFAHAIKLFVDVADPVILTIKASVE